MSMFNDISRGSRDNEEECKLNAKLVSLYAKRCGKGQGEWDNMAERMLLEFAESGCPIFRATTPLSRGRLKSKGHGKLSIHFAASGKPECDIHKHHKSQKRINVMENIDSVPSNVQSSRQEALLYVFEDNEAVIKMIIKGRSPTMRHVPRTHRVALDWLFDRINLESKIQIKYIDTKNQLADILTKGNFTRDEWNHLLCLFNISHFSSTVCSDTMAKRSQQDSGEERVTTKSNLMMNLIARTPSFVSSSTSVSPWKKHYGSQDPWKSVAGEDRSGRLGKGTDLFEVSDHHFHEQFMESFSSTDDSTLDYDRVWSSQEWRTETMTHDRSGQPDETSWRMVRKVRPDHEEILLDGTARSVRNEEVLRDRSGRLDDINFQEVANSQNFIMEVMQQN